MSFVPIGWSVKTFGEVLSLITNGMNGKQNKEGNGIPVSRIETIADQRVDLSRVGFLAEYDEGKIDKYRLEEGDILFSHINSPIHLGKTALVPSDIVLYHGVNLLRLKCEKSIDPRFFNYYCKYLRALGEFSKNAQHAVNQSSINQKKLKAFELVAPSLEEQKRIADKLDSVLAKVEAAQARLDKIPAILKRFRQSVLAAATSGELTKEWREERQLAYDYQQYTFDEILVELRNGLSAKPNEDRKGTPILRISSVRAMEIDQADIRYLELAAKEIEKYKLKVGDLLFTRYNGSLEFVGVCGVLENLKHDNLVYPDKLIRARLNEKALPKFIEILFSSPYMRDQVTGCVKTTSGQKGISGKDLKEQLIKLPSVSEQNEIVIRVTKLLAKSRRVEEKYAKARVRLDSLTQSILSKAFSGKLS